jgi:hypothetical protein
MFVVQKYLAYLVFNKDNPDAGITSFETAESEIPAVFEDQRGGFLSARLALSEARKYAKEQNNKLGDNDGT